jgi:general secretion pathway protein C
MKNGKPEGLKVYAIRPASLWAKLGVLNGDTLNAINGFDLSSMDQSLEVFAKVRNAKAIEVKVIRRGKPVILKYTVR